MFHANNFLRMMGLSFLASLGFIAIFVGPTPAIAATAPTLVAVGSYSVLAGSIATNTGPTTMPGDLGISPGIGVLPHFTGFPPGVVGPPGTIHDADANAAAAQADNTAAFGFIDQGCDVTFAGTHDLVGANLVPGVYCADAFALSGTLTLSGSGVWIFKSASTLITSGTANVAGGDPCNVWWRVVSSATLGTNTSLIGNILALTSITLNTGSVLNGRALAQTGAVTMDSNTITGPICAAAPTSATITVNKDFSPNSVATVPVALTCTSGTVTTTPLMAAEGAPAVFTVTGASPGATCTATETVPAGYTANEAGCVGVALNGSCTVINTQIPPAVVSVPTINQWGAIFFMMFAGLGSVYYLRKYRRV
jgi:hypothetical protein